MWPKKPTILIATTQRVPYSPHKQIMKRLCHQSLKSQDAEVENRQECRGSHTRFEEAAPGRPGAALPTWSRSWRHARPPCTASASATAVAPLKLAATPPPRPTPAGVAADTP